MYHQSHVHLGKPPNKSIQSTLSKTDTFGTGTKCPSWRDVRLIKSQIKGINKGRE